MHVIIQIFYFTKLVLLPDIWPVVYIAANLNKGEVYLGLLSWWLDSLDNVVLLPSWPWAVWLCDVT